MQLTKVNDLTFVVVFDDDIEAATKLQAMEDAHEIGSDDERASYQEAVVKNEILKYMSKRYGSNVGLIKQTVCRRAAVVRAFGGDSDFGVIPRHINNSIKKMLNDGTIVIAMNADTENECSVRLTGQGAEYIKTIK